MISVHFLENLTFLHLLFFYFPYPIQTKQKTKILFLKQEVVVIPPFSEGHLPITIFPIFLQTTCILEADHQERKL